MKTLATLLLALLFTNLLMAAGPSKASVDEANFFAAEAKKEFSLSDADTAKVLQMKLDGALAYGQQVYQARKAGDDAKADAAAKIISQSQMKHFCEIVGCKPNDYWPFAKKTKAEYARKK